MGLESTFLGAQLESILLEFYGAPQNRPVQIGTDITISKKDSGVNHEALKL